MKSKKILIVSNMYPSVKDPAYGTFVKVMNDELCKYLPDSQIDLVVIRGRGITKTTKLYKYIKFYIELLIQTIFYRYDLIYVHTITYPTPALRIASMFRNLNLIFNIHGVDLLTRTKYTELLKKCSFPLLKKSKYVVVPSVYYKEILRQQIPLVEDKKIVVSPSGGLSKNFYHIKNNVSNGLLKIGYVSRIVKGKGWDTFVKALKILDESGISFDAYMAGAGNMEDTLKLMITDSHVLKNNSIKMLGSFSHERLSTFYNNIDLFVFPSENKSESLGLVGLEAMAGSTPVIGSNIGGIATYLKDGINGFLFEPRNEHQLCDAIIRYYNMSENQKLEMSNNAYQTALNYESEHVCKKLYNTILN